MSRTVYVVAVMKLYVIVQDVCKGPRAPHLLACPKYISSLKWTFCQFLLAFTNVFFSCPTWKRTEYVLVFSWSDLSTRSARGRHARHLGEAWHAVK